jgi:hypothetical protein
MSRLLDMTKTRRTLPHHKPPLPPLPGAIARGMRARPRRLDPSIRTTRREICRSLSKNPAGDTIIRNRQDISFLPVRLVPFDGGDWAG